MDLSRFLRCIPVLGLVAASLSASTTAFIMPLSFSF